MEGDHHIGHTSRYLVVFQSLRENIGSEGLLKNHFDDCNVSSSINMLTIRKSKFNRFDSLVHTIQLLLTIYVMKHFIKYIFVLKTFRA